VIKPRLKRLASWLQQRHGAAVKVFVDTAPVMEKPLASAPGSLAGQAHQPGVTALRIVAVPRRHLLRPRSAADPPESDHCGACRACLDICPTRAFPAPYQLDARRCISYLTIEHKGHIPRELRPAIGNRIYGCDDCLAVCPWNKFAAASRELAFQPREALALPLLAELAALDDGAFRRRFAGTPGEADRPRSLRAQRADRAGNSGRPGSGRHRRTARRDTSPLVRVAAIWALGRLAAGDRFVGLRARHEPSRRIRRCVPNGRMRRRPDAPGRCLTFLLRPWNFHRRTGDDSMRRTRHEAVAMNEVARRSLLTGLVAAPLAVILADPSCALPLLKGSRLSR